MVNYLPLDALFEIFMRATIKTLLVCTSVCKLWHSIITSPSFMEAHLNWQKITRDLLIIRTFMRNSQKEVYSWHYDDLALDEVGHNSPYDHPYGNYYRIIDSCNGVLCLVDDHPTYIVDIILWNPAIRVWVKLPPQPVTSRSVVVLEHTTGFGVDPTSNDYKVIRVIYEQNDREVVPKVLMYTLSSSTWKNITHLAVGFGNMITGRSVTQSYLNGVVHWVAWCKKECRLAILSFHLSDEVFHRLELPVGVAITLNNLNGDLRPAVLHRLFSVVEMRRRVKCSVWVMEEYGVETSWVERYSINLRETFERFIGFRKSGRFLVDVQGKLYSYDPLVKDGTERNEKLKDLAIRSQTGHIPNSLYALGYFESLVLLGRQTEDSLLLDD